MKLLSIFVGFAVSAVVSQFDEIKDHLRLSGEKMIPYMSSQKSLSIAKRLQEQVNDDLYKFPFTNLDTNNDSFVDIGEIFTWLESFSKKVTKEEFLTSQLDYVAAFKRGQEKSLWGKPMDYETFKLYWTLYFVSDARIFHEVFDENGNGIMDDDDWNRMQSGAV